MKQQRLRDDAPDRMARVERRHRVLEDELHAPPQRAHLRFAEPRDVAPVEDDAAGGRSTSLQQRAPQGRLARPAFADDADGLAATDAHGDAAQSLDGRTFAPERAAPGAERDSRFSATRRSSVMARRPPGEGARSARAERGADQAPAGRCAGRRRAARACKHASAPRARPRRVRPRPPCRRTAA